MSAVFVISCILRLLISYCWHGVGEYYYFLSVAFFDLSALLFIYTLQTRGYVKRVAEFCIGFAAYDFYKCAFGNPFEITPFDYWGLIVGALSVLAIWAIKIIKK